MIICVFPDGHAGVDRRTDEEQAFFPGAQEEGSRQWQSCGSHHHQQNPRLLPAMTCY